jgi:hypothetical protein
MAYSNIMDFLNNFGEGIRETNPIYRKQKEIQQQQQFEAQQRQTTTPFERYQISRQTGLDKQAEQDRQYNFAQKTAELESKGILQRVDSNRNDIDTATGLPVDANTAPAAPGFDFKTAGQVNPAATGPGDSITNASPATQGAPTPTGIAGGSPAGSAPTPSGSGPSAPPWASLLPPPQTGGPLTGGVGAAPAGNTSANTQASRASSAQSGPLAQLSQGSTTPSQTAAGQTGSDSGALPSPTGSPAQKAIGTPDLVSPDGKIMYRFTTPEEQTTRQAALAKQQAAAQRELGRTNLNQWFKENPELAQDKDLVAALSLQNETGMKMPETTVTDVEAKLMKKAQAQMESGDIAGKDRTMDLITDFHRRQSIQNPPQKLMRRPDGSTYVALPGVSVGPQDREVGSTSGEKEPTPQIGYYKDSAGNLHSTIVRGNETNLPSNLQSQAGVNAVNTPTSTTRAMGEMAASVIPQAENVVKEIQALQDKLGPAAGRWNDLWVNKAGMKDPDFAGLDQDLDLLSSALVRTHFGARGGQAYQAEMKKNFSEAQSPEDLISRIQHSDSWLDGYAHAAGKVPGESTTPPPTGGPITPKTTTPISGMTPPPNLPHPLVKGQKLDLDNAQKYKAAFSGDKAKARQAAKNDGWDTSF